MAEIKSIDLSDGRVEMKLSLRADEYKILEKHTSDMVLLPCGSDSLSKSLTTGKLGNSNRVMLPKKLLHSSGINKLEKKVSANIFPMNGDAYLLIKIKKSKLGIPKFGDDDDS